MYKNRHLAVLVNLAEQKGFEPLIELPLYTISSRAHSTALPLLLCLALYISQNRFARVII